MKCFKTYLLLGIFLILCSAVWADIPKQINFQGVLRDSVGNPYPDGNYSITFRIYDAASGGTIFWREVQTVSLSGGLFTTLLGSVTAIPESAFSDSLRWLGVQVASNPEISPRQQLVSVPYSYVADLAQDADKLGGSDESNFVRRTGPDSVVSASGTAFLGKVSGNSVGFLFGIRGDATNASTTGAAIGSHGVAYNTSTGAAYGGLFQIGSSGGTGFHYGVYGEGRGSSSNPTYGSYSTASNTSTGTAYGGYLTVSSSGTGTHYGVYGVETAGGTGAAVYASGDFAASGTKSAVLKTSQGERLFYTMESPEVWFEDFGEGQLSNGNAHIELDPLFLETVTINSSNPMKVFIQLKDDCKGVYVKTQTTGFDVFELQSGLSNASFSYRLVAKRKGYENQRLPQTTLGMDDPNLYPELWQEIEKRHQEVEISKEIDE